MALEDSRAEMTMREKMALRILAIMYRLVSPNDNKWDTDRDLRFILTGKEKD